MIRYLSLFSGIEAATVAWHDLGFSPVAFAEIDPFPCAVLSYHFPNVPNLGDVTQINGAEYAGAVDLIVGGSPCFTAGTLILTNNGLVPIENIKIGDIVCTHTGKWRKVLATGNRISKTILVKGQGQSWGVHTTHDHPFYAMCREMKFDSKKRTYFRKFHEPKWIKAKDLNNCFWSTPINYEFIPPVMPELIGNEKNLPELTPEFMRFCGQYVGNGWTRFWKNRRALTIICCNKKKEHITDEVCKKIGLPFRRDECRTVIKFYVHGKCLARWIEEQFGHGAENKTIPAWLLSAPLSWRKAFWKGYMETDGSICKNGDEKATTISHKLVLGLRLLANSLGKSASCTFHIPNRTAVIEGRIVNEKPQYHIQTYDNPRSSIEMYNMRWGLVRKIEEANEERVYNIEVEEDNSYIADGFAAHNCQSFSVAGKQAGLDGVSGLAMEFIRLVSEIKPKFFLWENVPGAFSTNKGSDYASIIVALEECGYCLAWRVLDARYYGTPQRRRRVFLVYSLAGNTIGRKEGNGGNGTGCQENISYTLNATDVHSIAAENIMPRRLTPIECERLQGFEDNWTLVPFKGELAKDTPRYKAIGNSMAVPVMRWIGKRIKKVMEEL